MLTAEEIEKKAKQFMEDNPTVKQKIEGLLNNESDLFVYFLDKVKENQPYIVSYILNFCFDNAIKRANFGNRQDEHGNSAYHYAAEKGHDDIVIILNDRRKFHNKKSYFRFTLKNKQDKKPLDLCCEKANLSTFKLIWERVGKSNHNPMHALNSVCLGGNIEMINVFLNHSKFKPKKGPTSTVNRAGLEGKFGEEIRQVFLTKNARKCETTEKKRKSTSGLEKNNLFAEKERGQISKRRKVNLSHDNSASDLSINKFNQSTFL